MSEVELLYKSDFRGLAGPHPLLVDLRSSEPVVSCPRREPPIGCRAKLEIL